MAEALNEPEPAAAKTTEPPASAWAPFRHRAFLVIWIATVVSNTGSWMYNAASGWLMLNLAPDPLIVSLVQVAASLPMFLLALPAGALADLADRRRLLLAIEIATTLVAAVFALFVALNLVTPAILLLFALLIGICGVLATPSWQAVVPQLVPNPVLSPAVSANSVGFNVSRAIGPALGGLVIGSFGIAAPFWLNVVSNLGVVGALIWWRPPARGPRHLPAERFWNAMVSGVRYSRHNPHLTATMIRSVGFFLFAMAYWALLPLVAKDRINGGAALYGIMLGAIGAGAVAGAFLLPMAKARLGADRLVGVATGGTVVALALFGIARDGAVGIAACLVAGVSWIAILATLNVSAQVALPEWVRGRGLAVYMTISFGAMTLGSILWGKVAGLVGVPNALFLAAAGALAAVPLTWRWKLQTGAGLDLAPSMHWTPPIRSRDFDDDHGPVMVTVEYRVDPAQRAGFLAALEVLSHERRRDGAYAWGIFEDAADATRLIETFLVDSWIEHLRQHERVTNADRVMQDAVSHFQVQGIPLVTHFIAADLAVSTADPPATQKRP
jgi:MFS family permease